MADRNKSKKRTLVEYMELLSTTHTMRIKEICRMLKCSRTYVDSNIVSYFKDNEDDYVFVGDKSVLKELLESSFNNTIVGKWKQYVEIINRNKNYNICRIKK